VAAVAAEHVETNHVRFPDDGASRFGCGLVLGAGRTLHRVIFPLAVPLYRSSFWLLGHPRSLVKAVFDVTFGEQPIPDSVRIFPSSATVAVASTVVRWRVFCTVRKRRAALCVNADVAPVSTGSYELKRRLCELKSL